MWGACGAKGGTSARSNVPSIIVSPFFFCFSQLFYQHNTVIILHDMDAQDTKKAEIRKRVTPTVEPQWRSATGTLDDSDDITKIDRAEKSLP